MSADENRMRPEIERRHPESWLRCLQRYCMMYGADMLGVMQSFEKLRFNGYPEEEAAIEAAWVHGLYDTKEDMKTGVRLRVKCEFEEHVDAKGKEFVIASCTRCGHTTHSYRTHAASRRRCLALMREECPLHSSNYYVEYDDDDGETVW